MEKHYNNCKLFDTDSCPHKDNEDLIFIRTLIQSPPPPPKNISGNELKNAQAVCLTCNSFKAV
jgi:hypothetical protein